MPTVNDVIKDVIFEEKNQTLELMYDIDVFIQEFKDEEDEETPEVNAAEPVATAEPAAEEEGEDAATQAAESTDAAENAASEELLNEAIYKRTVNGNVTVPQEDAKNIQALEDLIDYMSDTDHKKSKKSVIAKVLGKKGNESSDGKIISPLIQDVILILSGAGSGNKQLSDIVNEGDKVIVEVKYGKDEHDNIGFKINKKAGTEIFTIMLIKDSEVLPGQFNQTLLNKQILYYRNSVT